jgi:predicted P-loop ATPase/GTPase
MSPPTEVISASEPSARAAMAAIQIFTPAINNQPINEAHIPRLEATDRSTPPVVMMMKTIGSIINPNSMKSDEVREIFFASRK